MLGREAGVVSQSSKAERSGKVDEGIRGDITVSYFNLP